MTKSVNAKNAFKVQKREHICEDQENDELNLALSKTKLWVSTSQHKATRCQKTIIADLCDYDSS
jgi:hypothetical protein